MNTALKKSTVTQDFQTYFSPAKINLFLHIVGQRADGYHLLQSVFQLLDLYDHIHLKPNNSHKIIRVNSVAGVPESTDLTIRAAQKLQQYALTINPKFNAGVEIKVDKYIPMGGGLGGGSSNAATVLLALNQLWQLNLSRKTLMQIGLQLGADVPFFIFGQNAWVEGIGEKLQAIPLLAHHYVIVNPKIHVSTQQIFGNKQLTKNTIPKTMSDFSSLANLSHDFPAGRNVKSSFINQLENVVCNEYPAVKQALDWLKQFGDARMTGSGASIFVEVASASAALNVLKQKPEALTGFIATGLNQHPLYDFCA